MTAKVLPFPRFRTGETNIVRLDPVISDEALLAACATGDKAALGELFDRFNEAVYRFAGRLQMTDDLARDDLVQATFLEVCRTAHAFRGTSSVKTWILTARSEHRRRTHQAGYLEKASTTPTLVGDQVDRRRLLGRIADAVAALPRDQQIAFILCDLEQLPGGEVARVLEIPEGTLYRRLHQARKAVRAAVERSTP
jgi:RNA polymerase sigma-70 factor, ECF subfamily